MDKLKFSNIDLNNTSKEELGTEIERLTKLMNDEENLNQGLKILLVSAYGAIGNKYFVAYNPDVAEAVTLQGQDIIKFSADIVDKYFHDFWYKDKYVHKKLGITTEVKQISDAITTVIYIDTDSVHKDTVINCENNIKIPIEILFNKYGEINGIIKDDRNNEIVENDNNMINVLNYSEDRYLHSIPIKKIIRHKVNKDKWILKTKLGKSIIITNDHSLVVYRNSLFIEIKPYNVKKTDKVLIINYNNSIKYDFDEISLCEKIGTFDNEYVYDIEVDDITHTFIGNDILVHNSNFITFTPAINSCDYEHDKLDFILKLYNIRLKEFFNTYLDKYASKYNIKNLQSFELEKIAESGIWLGKKKYVNDIIWKHPNIKYKSLSKIVFKGVEIVQKSTPKFARDKLKLLITYIFGKEHSELKTKDIISFLKQYKEEFKLENIDNISFSRGISDYEKYILNDKQDFVIGKRCPVHVRAAGIYNYTLNKNKKYMNKYHFIKTSDKVKYYYVKDSKNIELNIFGYLNGDYPIEFAPEYDYDLMFKKTIIDPINRFMTVLNKGLIPDNLISPKELW